MSSEKTAGRILFEALVAEEDLDKKGNRFGLGGFQEADGDKTILDGVYDLERVAAAFLAAYRAQQASPKE